MSGREVGHTPGPWTYHNGQVLDANGRPVPLLLGGPMPTCWSPYQVNCNLRLIAAAPELLAACAAALERFGGVMIDDINRHDPAVLADMELCCKLTHAIAQAKGELPR